MVTILWTLVCLSAAVTAPTGPPGAADLTLTSVRFAHVLRWSPGPGTPAEAYYHVTFTTQRGTSWSPVAGCERVRPPLVCDLTEALSDPHQVYIINVTALLEGRALRSDLLPRFLPIRDTQLDPPLLTLAPCGGHLCVDFEAPQAALSGVYGSLRYGLRVSSGGVDRNMSAMFLRREVLRDLNPGREYCVSVRFHDSLAPRQSDFGEPVCHLAPGGRAAGVGHALIAVPLCVALALAAALLAMLVTAGVIVPIKVVLPPVLTTVLHVDSDLVFRSPSLTSLLTVRATAPPAGEWQVLSEESEEQSGGDSGACYAMWDRSILPSSAVAPPEAPPPGAVLSSSSWQTLPQAPEGGPTYAAPPRIAEAPEGDVSGGEEEEEEEGGGCSQDVNLLTLTFGTQAEDKLDFSSEDVTSSLPAPAGTPPSCPVDEEEEEEGGSHQDINLFTLTFGTQPEDKLDFSSEDVTSYLPAASGTPPSCPVDEDEEEEEESGYMGRPSVQYVSP